MTFISTLKKWFGLQKTTSAVDSPTTPNREPIRPVVIQPVENIAPIAQKDPTPIVPPVEVASPPAADVTTEVKTPVKATKPRAKKAAATPEPTKKAKASPKKKQH